jgi:hypothetical protein
MDVLDDMVVELCPGSLDELFDAGRDDTVYQQRQ